MAESIHDNGEWEDRVALQRFLVGDDRPTFIQYARSFASGWAFGPWAVGTEPRSSLSENLIRSFDLTRNPLDRIDRFSVRYVVLPGNAPRPAYMAAGWKPVQIGRYWQIWQRVPRK